MNLLDILVCLGLAAEILASNVGNFEYNHMLGIWLPKHEVWTDEHHINHHATRQKEKYPDRDPSHQVNAAEQEAGGEETGMDEKAILDSYYQKFHNHKSKSHSESAHQVPGIANQHVLHDHDHDHDHEHDTHKSTTPRLIVYVQTFTTPDGKPLSLLPLLEHKTGITHVILASVHLHETPGEIRLNDHAFGDERWDRLWEEVRVLRGSGVKVMLMLGGQAGGSTWERLGGTDSEFYKYYTPLLHLLRTYPIDGLDIDIETPVPLTLPIRLLTSLHRDLGPSFILTMAPLSSALLSPSSQNLSGFSYFLLDEFATAPGSDAKLVHWYNAMFYGDFKRGPPRYEDVVEEGGWDARRVVMGVLDCSADGNPNGFVHLESLGERVRELRMGMNGGFGGVGGWEYWDAGQSEFEKVEPWMWVKKVGEALFEELPYEEEGKSELR